MKHSAFLAIALIALALAGCTGKSTTSASKPGADSVPNTPTLADSTAATAASPQDAQELEQAVTQEHADSQAIYTYDRATNTVKIVKQVDIPANQAEEDFAEAIVEHEVPEFISQFKKSTKPSDVTIKNKRATITVSYVNKATGEEITQFDITPDDLK